MTYGSEGKCTTHYTTAPHNADIALDFCVTVKLSIRMIETFSKRVLETRLSCSKRLSPIRSPSVPQFGHRIVNIS